MQHCTDYSTWTGRWWAARGRRTAVNPTGRSGRSEWWRGSRARPTRPSTRPWRLLRLVGRGRCRSRTGGCSSLSASARCTGPAQFPAPGTPPGGEGGVPAGRGSPRPPGPPYTCGCGRFEVGRGCSWAPRGNVMAFLRLWQALKQLFELIYICFGWIFKYNS